MASLCPGLYLRIVSSGRLHVFLAIREKEETLVLCSPVCHEYLAYFKLFGLEVWVPGKFVALLGLLLKQVFP
jgi:hypothetical protein